MASPEIKILSSVCGFCKEGRQEDCANAIASVVPHAKSPNGILWICPTAANLGLRKCITCHNRTTNEVSEVTYKCLDVEACSATMETKREASGFFAQLSDIRKKVQMAKVENAEKAAKAVAPKEGTCVCGCKGKTKGGLFLPGHDARFVSQTVAVAEEAGFTKTAVDAGLASIKKAGASETLQAKYTKAIGLAKERKAKKDAAAKEKSDAKAAKEKEKASK